MKKKNILYALAALLTMGVTACSDNDPATPLAPPAQEEVEAYVVDVKSEDYSMYVGGNVIGEGIANYYFVLSNATCELNEREFPTPVTDGDMVVLDLYATISDGSTASIPAGEYRLGYQYNPFTFNVDNTMVVRNTEAKIQYEAVVGGTILVTPGENGNTDLRCELQLASGEVTVYHFNGQLTFEDITDTWGSKSTLKVDMIDTQFTDTWAVYYGNMFETNTGNFMLYFYTDGFADNMKQPGSMLALCLFSDLANNPAKAEIKEGEYSVVPLVNGYGAKFSLMGGELVNGNPFGTYAMKVDEDGYSGTGFITKGTVIISKKDKEYTIEYDLLTDNKKSIKGTIIKELNIENQSDDSGKAFISNLEADVHTELPKVKEGTWTWKGTVTGAEGKELDLWSIWLQAPQGDAMAFEFATELGLDGQIPDGTYTTDTHHWAERFTPSTAVAGYLWDGKQRGCWYFHFKEGQDETTGLDYYYNMDINAPAIEEGTVTVKKQENGHYRFEWSFVDDAPGQHKITGNWTGPIRAFDPEIDGFKTIKPVYSRDTFLKGWYKKVYKLNK